MKKTESASEVQIQRPIMVGCSDITYIVGIGSIKIAVFKSEKQAREFAVALQPAAQLIGERVQFVHHIP